MPYVIVQGNVGDRQQKEGLAAGLTETVASLFQVPRGNVVVVVQPGTEEIIALAGGNTLALELEVTVEGAGIGEGEIARVVQDVTTAVSRASGKKADQIMVLVKVPGGPHMKMTSRCCGIGGKLLS